MDITLTAYRKIGTPTVASFCGLALVVVLVPVLQAFHGTSGSLGQSIPLLFLAPVLICAAIGGRAAGIAVAIIAVLAWDWFFIRPSYRITIESPRDVVALFIFLAVAIVIGQLADTVRARTREISRRAQTTEALYELSVALIARQDVADTLSLINERLCLIFDLQACALLVAGSETMWKTAGSYGSLPSESVAEQNRSVSASASWAARTGSIAGFDESNHNARTDDNRPRSRMSFLPLQVGEGCVGVLQLLEKPGARLDHDSEQLLSTLANGLALALEQDRLAGEERAALIARESDRLKSVLLSSVSHDLRTPLAGIMASATSLLQKDVKWSEEDRESFVRDISCEADRLSALVSNLLDLSRIEAGELHPNKEYEDIGEIVRNVVNRARAAIGKREIDITIDKGLPLIQVDAVQIGQVLTNLIENAARYSADRTTIAVAAVKDEERHELILSVTDEGIGIPEHLQERVFDKFYRVGDTNRVGGTGMGLAIVKGLVEANGGSVRLDSVLGKGSAFQVIFPCPAEKPRDVHPPPVESWV